MASGFPTTQWSVVIAARDGTDGEARSALEALCEAYWYPLYAYVRHRGHDPDEAMDLTQGFFAELLRGNLLRPVDRSKGHFRAFLLASMRNFLAHQHRRERAAKRGGGAITLSLDALDAERRFESEPVDRLTPEAIFERRWGLTIMERAMRRLQAESTHGPEQFERLRAHLTATEPSQPYREAAAELGMTEGAFKTAVHRLRREYGRLLRAEIGETISDRSELDAELRHLLSVIQPWEGEGR